jgi:hypothetical protein
MHVCILEQVNIAAAYCLGIFPASAMPILSTLTADLDGLSAALMAFEAVFITWLMLDKKHLSAFAARKLCHAGSGVIMMMLNCDAMLCRLFVYAVALGSLASNWQLLPKLLPNFWFGSPRDKGITLYLILVALWVYNGSSLRILAPVFLADPAGAVVGKFASRHFPAQNKQWIGTKTVCGSFAVFLATYASLHAPRSPVPRLLVSVLAALGEAVGGAYDNLAIALVVVVASGVVM